MEEEGYEQEGVTTGSIGNLPFEIRQQPDATYEATIYLDPQGDTYITFEFNGNRNNVGELNTPDHVVSAMAEMVKVLGPSDDPDLIHHFSRQLFIYEDPLLSSKQALAATARRIARPVMRDAKVARAAELKKIEKDKKRADEIQGGESSKGSKKKGWFGR